ncbi:SIEVE ELEMENT OCCLUSION B protein [Spatholobus suberectus]|nr:SIEVE ELEMENT OCCLUSION B protein [Spatholobus suberectus]
MKTYSLSFIAAGVSDYLDCKRRFRKPKETLSLLLSLRHYLLSLCIVFFLLSLFLQHYFSRSSLSFEIHTTMASSSRDLSTSTHKGEVLVARSNDQLQKEGGRSFVPIPLFEEESKKIWETQVLLPFSLADNKPMILNCGDSEDQWRRKKMLQTPVEIVEVLIYHNEIHDHKVYDGSTRQMERGLQDFVGPHCGLQDLRVEMPWYVVEHFRPLAGIRLIREDLNYKNKPIIPVLNPQGRVVNNNAMHMIFVWGIDAFPFRPSDEDVLTRNGIGSGLK